MQKINQPWFSVKTLPGNPTSFKHILHCRTKYLIDKKYICAIDTRPSRCTLFYILAAERKFIEAAHLYHTLIWSGGGEGKQEVKVLNIYNTKIFSFTVSSTFGKIQRSQFPMEFLEFNFKTSKFP